MMGQARAEKIRAELAEIINEHGARLQLQTIECPVCEQPFEQKRHWQTFCSKRCRNKYHLLKRGR